MIIDWIPSPYFNVIANREIKQILIHTAECQETPNARKGIGAWFADVWRKIKKMPLSSAHYGVDPQGIAQYVRDHHVAWHAGRVNNRSIGIELAGSARQSPEQWADDYSMAVLRNAAWLVAKLCAEHKIPIVRLDDAGILLGSRGLFGHVDANRAYDVKGGHTDPGPNFPWDLFIDMVRAAAVS